MNMMLIRNLDWITCGEFQAFEPLIVIGSVDELFFGGRLVVVPHFINPVFGYSDTLGQLTIR